MIHTLYISLWYPNRRDAMSGLFVRKHALAASQYCKITVLHVMPDDTISEIELVHQSIESLNEVYVYVPVKGRGILKKIFQLFYFFLGYHLGFNAVVKLYGKPNLVQSHILTRTGFMAWFIKFRYQIPYLIYEHWSRFLPFNITYKNSIHKIFTQFIVRNASAVLTVSEILRAGMQVNGLDHPHFYRVNNVVDDFFFQVSQTKTSIDPVRFLNISCFDERSKNLSGLIRSSSKLAERYQNFELILVGIGKDFEQIKIYASKFANLKNKVFFTGELTPQEVKKQIDQCTCITQFSHFETAGIVVAEAMACGKYIISSSVGIAPEYISEDNGKLIPVGDENSLTEAMADVIEGKFPTASVSSREKAYREFSFEKVGKRLYEIYKKTLSV